MRYVMALIVVAGCTGHDGLPPQTELLVPSNDGGPLPDISVPPNQCTDHFQDGVETDIDCGGGVCVQCGTGLKCRVGSDCQTGQCIGGLCGMVSACNDGIKDDGETDVDCGGGVCKACQLGQGCIFDTDCQSQSCMSNRCTNPTLNTCTDGVIDGGESDVDCGGKQCPTCGVGRHCFTNLDCASGFCAQGFCQIQTSSCTNGIQDGFETDIDCGGGQCPACAIGRRCVSPKDCQSFNCMQGICGNANSCFDGVRNGFETDVDCGGGQCAPCANFKQCLSAKDCQSGFCQMGICQPPTSGISFVYGSTTPNATSCYATSLAAGDFNQDGMMDVATGNSCGTATLLLGSLSNPFKTASEIKVGGGPCLVKVADMNLDGRLDMVVTAQGAGTLSVGMNTGNGQIVGSTVISFGQGSLPGGIAIADFNLDKYPDVAVSLSGMNAVMVFPDSGMNGPPMNFPAGIPTPQSIAAADVNRDGMIDLVVGSSMAPLLATLLAVKPGYFALQQVAMLPAPASALVLADFNGDGVLDAAVTLPNISGVMVFVGNGKGGFSPGPIVTVAAGPVGLATADWNSDGLMDLVSVSPTDFNVLQNTGGGNFKSVYNIPGAPGLTAVVVADFTNDGKPDFVVSAMQGNGLYLFANTSH